MLGALPEATDEARAVPGVVGIGAGVDVDEAVLEGAIDQDGELAGGRRDGRGPPDPRRQAPMERAKGRASWARWTSRATSHAASCR